MLNIVKSVGILDDVMFTSALLTPDNGLSARGECEHTPLKLVSPPLQSSC